jgi:DNA-directed RNA polymerase subunit RPC12/RpoP
MPFLRCLGCGVLVRSTADSCPHCSFPLRIPAAGSALVPGPGPALGCADCGTPVAGASDGDGDGAPGPDRCPSCGATFTGERPTAGAA